MKTSNLIFDVDGTLVDSIPGIESSIREAVGEILGIRQIPGIRTLIGPPIGVILRKILPDQEDSTILQIEAKFREFYNSSGWKQSPPYPGMLETLVDLKQEGHRLFIVTNKPSIPTRNILQSLEILDLFEACMCPDMRDPRYSSKSEMLRSLIERFSLFTGATCYIGDQPEDGNAASDCDILFIGAGYGYGEFSHPGNQKNRIINTPRELAEIFCRDEVNQ